MRRRLFPSLVVAAAGCFAQAPSQEGTDVVLVTIESLRVDHVGAYGGASPGRPEVPITPEIDAFAREAVVYEDAHAVTSWTLASHASLFTGLYPSGHRATGPLDRLDDSYPTLAEVLAERGWQTAGVVSGPYLRRTHNLHQGFAHYDESAASITNLLAHDDVTNPRMELGLRRFMDEQRDPARPLLLFAYFWDPHFDYLPPHPYDTMFVPPGAEPFDLRDFDRNADIHAEMSAARRAWLLAQYAGEIRWTDSHIGRLFTLLRQRGSWDDALVIVTADHGEEFFDHGEKGHKKNLHAETVHVPLIVKYPGQRDGRRDPRPVSLVDVLPTVLDVAGVQVDFPVHGRSLRAAGAGERPLLYELRSVWYSESGGEVRGRETPWKGVRRGDWKAVWSEPEGEAPLRRLFHVGRDPRERDDLAGEHAETVAELEEVFAGAIESAQRDAERYRPGGRAQLSAEEIEQLRALGYFDR